MSVARARRAWPPAEQGRDRTSQQAAGAARAHRRLERARTGFLRLAGVLPEEAASDATAQGPAERIGAAYDHRHKRIILVQGAIQTRRELELVLAHELTHALEDQHFPLRLMDSVGPTQRADARRAVIEGTATFVAALYAGRYLGDEISVTQRLAGQRSIYAAGGPTPYAVKAVTIFDYVDGALFVRRLHLRAKGWALVNRALSQPPVRTQEILHPGKWSRGPPPRAVRLDLGHLLGADWRRVGGGLAGEQDALAVLGAGAPDAGAKLGAAGWAGGSFELWRPRGDQASCEDCEGNVGVVAFRWRDRLDAWEFARAFFAYMLVGRLGERIGRRAWDLGNEGFANLSSARRASAIAFAPSEELATSAAESAALQAAGR